VKLVWLDIETTGLSPERHSILEVAFAAADLAVPFSLLGLDSSVLRYEDRHTLGSQCLMEGRIPVHDNGPCRACDFSPFVRSMHKENGLLAESSTSTTTLAEVEDSLLDLVRGEPESGDEKPTLAGSSVHFDHGFLRVHIPRFAARLSHRHYDVSAVKLFCESVGMPRIPKAQAHRAREDVLESIAHARQCAVWLAAHWEWRVGPLFDPSSFVGGGDAGFPPESEAEPFVHRSLTLRSPSVSPVQDGSADDHALKEPPPVCGTERGFGTAWCTLDAGHAPPCSLVPLSSPAARAQAQRERRDGAVVDRGGYGERFLPVQQRAHAEPDAHCATTPDGGCASASPDDVHRPSGA
jgi:oligoribonuclease